MEDRITSTTNITLQIPNQKIIGAAQNIMNSYMPLIEESVREVEFKLYHDEELKQHIKELVKERIEEIIKETTESAIKSAISTIFFSNQKDVERVVKEILLERIKN